MSRIVRNDLNAMYSEEFQARFWSKVEKTEGCWLWTGGCFTTGYGQIVSASTKTRLAHRISLEMHLGRPIRSGFVVAHLPVICHTPKCVNPAHLREATLSENARDKRLDGTQRLGRAHTGGNPRKFTDEQVRIIRNDTRSLSKIADDYGCCFQTISNIKSHKLYVWVTD